MKFCESAQADLAPQIKKQKIILQADLVWNIPLPKTKAYLIVQVSMEKTEDNSLANCN
jgi:hypothetical protein